MKLRLFDMQDQVKLGQDQVKPGQDQVKPGQDQVKLGQDQVKLGQDQVKPGHKLEQLFTTDCAWQLLNLCLLYATVAAFPFLYPLIEKSSSVFKNQCFYTH